jgi:hypothetical protein
MCSLYSCAWIDCNEYGRRAFLYPGLMVPADDRALSCFLKIRVAGQRSTRRTTPDGIFIPSVTFGEVPKGRLAHLSRKFQAGFPASLKRTDGLKKPARRKIFYTLA